MPRDRKRGNGQKGKTNPASPSSRLEPPSSPTKLVFQCQEAEGGKIVNISNFGNVVELYDRIGEELGFPSDQILFCTLNTHRIDMDNLLSSHLCLEDFIFVHRKGTKKEVEVTKTDEALGLTITDNGRGYAFIKRIRNGSLIDGIRVILIGDHIEAINGISTIGKKHVEVARLLKDIPIGSTFIIRLIEPLRSGFANVGLPTNGIVNTKSIRQNYGNGLQTLRFRSKGPAELIQITPEEKWSELILTKVNDLLESFLGINDVDLAQEIWDLVQGKLNSMEVAEALDTSELDTFGFTDDFVIELWGIVSDITAGRLKAKVPIAEDSTGNDFPKLDVLHQLL